MSIYQPPDPPIGPDRDSNAYPVEANRAEAAAVRAVGPRAREMVYADPERFASHDEWACAYEIWGEDL